MELAFKAVVFWAFLRPFPPTLAFGMGRFFDLIFNIILYRV